MKQSPELSKIQERMKPGVITGCGFLGADTRNLVDILIDDDAAVQRLKTTHLKIAEKMKYFRDKGLEGLGMFEKVDDHFETKVDSMRGRLPSPFNDQVMVDKQNTTVRNLRLGREIIYSDLQMHMIEYHGFYQGKGSLFRIDPEELVKVLEIVPDIEKSLPDYYPSGR